MDQLERTVDYINDRLQEKPRYGIILGSGLGEITESVKNKSIHLFTEIPGWPIATVKGHIGELVLGNIEKTSVLIMNGRIHYYEGYSMERVTYPIRVMQKLGIINLIITNAAGAVNPDFQPGDVMLITDHINLMGMSGKNPLRGKNIEQFGPRFPDMSQAYNREMMKIIRNVALDNNLELREGVYAGLSGPSFETPAELRFLKTIGVDAVGMSTVPEVIVARHGNMNVLGLSGISNKANLNGDSVTTHEEVLQAGRILSPKIEKLIEKFIKYNNN